MPRMTAPSVKTSVDRVIHALQGRMTQGLAPASLMVAYVDWLLHFLNSPGKIGEVIENAMVKGAYFNMWAAKAIDPQAPPIIEPLEQDYRFHDGDWKKWPFNVMYQGFLMAEQWWHYATSGISGVSRHHEDMVGFGARQFLDVFSPANNPWTNPQVLRATVEQGGANLQQGFRNFQDDLQALASGERRATEGFKVGENLAVTPGKVVLRNDLIELIQYAPATPKVRAEPVLIVPAWIMKYYILDLSPHNSLVKYLVDKGHTVFMVSWKNPGHAERNLGMDDYHRMGIMAALDAINAIVPKQKIHAVGYCLGGTLLAIAAATLARDGDDRLKTVSLFTAQTDFTEAGELMLFIDESQLSFMEDVMWDRGFLDTKQMVGAFQLLRSNDLIWSRIVQDYLLGQRSGMNDLMAWNADATRMPYRMHSEYLRRLFLDNDLSSGRYEVEGKPIALSDIRAPLFMVATTKDHVAPWKSVYKIHLQADTDITFVLCSGGHNAGIVSEPGKAKRRYQIAIKRDLDRYIDPDEWVARTPLTDGSWWEPWEAWLTERSAAKLTAPPHLGAPEAGYPVRGNAPGTYVMEP